MKGKYRLNGHYKQEEVKGAIEGEIAVDKDGIVTGTLTDRLSPSNERAVTGKMTKNKSGTVRLELLCNVADENLLNILYTLIHTGMNAEGEYYGSWIPVQRILNLRLKGSFEARDGETWHYGDVTRLVPFDKDSHHQYAELSLEKIA